MHLITVLKHPHPSHLPKRLTRTLAQVYTAISSSLSNPSLDPAKALSEAEALIQGLTGDPASKGLAAKAVTAATGASKLGSKLGIPFASKPRPNMTGEDAGTATMVSGRWACLSFTVHSTTKGVLYLV